MLTAIFSTAYTVRVTMKYLYDLSKGVYNWYWPWRLQWHNLKRFFFKKI